jgi:hypothetical protein
MFYGSTTVQQMAFLSCILQPIGQIVLTTIHDSGSVLARMVRFKDIMMTIFLSLTSVTDIIQITLISL